MSVDASMKRDPLPSVVPVGVLVGIQFAWRSPLLALALALAWITICFFDTAAAMVGIWARSDTFAHGFVVAPISLWLIWRMRARLFDLTPRPSVMVVPLLAAAGFVWLVGEAAAVNVATQFAFVAMLVLVVPTLLGIQVARTMLFPLAFLFFSVPFGEFLMPALMSQTADFTIVALRASGIPVYREGLQFVIPTGRWSVVEACSGIRYLIASIVVGALFAYLNYSSVRKRIAFMAVSIVTPIVANWLRAYMIVMLGHLSSNRLATGLDHLVYGWVFFGLVMLVMFWIGSRFRDASDVAEPSNAAAIVNHSDNRRIARALIGVVLATVLWPFLDRAIASRNGSTTLYSIEVPGWQAVRGQAPSFTPSFQGPSAVYQEELAQGDRRAGVYVAYYRGQNADRKLVSSENLLVRSDDHVWNTILMGTRKVELGGTTTDVGTAQVRRASGELLTAWQWYWVDGALTASGLQAKVRIAWNMLRGRGDDSAAIVVYALADGKDQARTDAMLQDFLAAGWPAISHVLDQASSRPQ
jgi:exosortase A